MQVQNLPQLVADLRAVVDQVDLNLRWDGTVEGFEFWRCTVLHLRECAPALAENRSVAPAYLRCMAVPLR
jgi:hypothetical protein